MRSIRGVWRPLRKDCGAFRGYATSIVVGVYYQRDELERGVNLEKTGRIARWAEFTQAETAQ